MTKTLLAIIAVMFGVPAAPVMAGFYDGNMLYERCSSDSVTERALCMGYVIGVYDTYQVNPVPLVGMVCPPENATAQQMTDIVIHYLRDNPANRTARAETLVGIALSLAFRCPLQ